MRRNLQSFLGHRPAVAGLVVVLLLVFAAVFAPMLTRHDPVTINMAQRLRQPSAEHWLGADRLGRDLLARLMYGGRVSIFIGLFSALSAGVIGIVLGCIAGYFGGTADAGIVYISEIIMCFPQTLLILILVGFLGQGIMNLIVIFAITGWVSLFRIVRSRIQSLKEEPFVESCIANGIGGFSIMFKHLLPNTLGLVIVSLTLSSAGYILAEAGLSFLGLGVPAEIPTWGNMMNAAKSLDIVVNYPIQWIAPGIVISLFVLGLNFFGDGLRDVFDPTQRGVS